MATSNTAIFPQTIHSATAVATAAAASTTGDTPTGDALLLTTGADGGEVTRLTVLPRATCAATVAYLWASTDSGTTKRLINAVAIAADTVSTTDAPKPVDFGYSDDAPLRLGPSVSLYVGVSVALASGFVFAASHRGYSAGA